MAWANLNHLAIWPSGPWLLLSWILHGVIHHFEVLLSTVALLACRETAEGATSLRTALESG